MYSQLMRTWFRFYCGSSKKTSSVLSFIGLWGVFFLELLLRFFLEPLQDILLHVPCQGFHFVSHLELSPSKLIDCVKLNKSTRHTYNPAFLGKSNEHNCANVAEVLVASVWILPHMISKPAKDITNLFPLLCLERKSSRWSLRYSSLCLCM